MVLLDFSGIFGFESKSMGRNRKIPKAIMSIAAMIINFLFCFCLATISIFRAIYFGRENIKNILHLNYYIISDETYRHQTSNYLFFIS